MKGLLFAAVFLARAVGSASAQDLPTRVEEPGLKTKDTSRATKAAQESEKRSEVGEGPDVAYEQVLARPDDIELNFQYARTQVRKGNLRSAVTSLERILMVKPDLPKVRLTYAIVLFRLDNAADAERELIRLRSEKMPVALRAEVEDYIAQLRRRRRRTHISALLGTGIDYDDNRNAAPATGKRLFFDTPVTLLSNSTRKGDVAKMMLASLGLRHDLGYQAGHLVMADYSYYRAEQTNVKLLNLQNHAADVGGLYRAPWGDLTATFEFDHLLLAQTTYLRSRGGRVRFDRKLTPRLGLFLETAYTRQEYSKTPFVPNGDDRTGDKYDGAFGGSYVLTPTMSLMAGYTHTNQGAVAKFFAYSRESLNLTHTWLLGRGQFLLTSAFINFDRYEQPDVTVSKKYRHDNTYRGRVTYGVPLALLHPRLSDFVFTVGYEYYHALSRDIPNYAYSNNKLSSLLTFKWEL